MKNTIKLSIAASLLLTTINAEEVLEPITVISINKTTQNIKDTTSNITVITAEEMEEKGYHTVAEAIMSVAGISVAQSGGMGQQTSFFVRGADSGKVLVLLDGMRLNDPSTTNGTALLDTLTTSNIEQIEIIKGGMSSIWGSNASAGVINIITKQPKDGTRGSVSLQYGSYDTKALDADISYQNNKFSAQLLASYLDTEGISALVPQDAEADGYTNKNINLKLGYKFDESNRVILNFNRIDNDSGYDVGSANDTISTTTSQQDNMALNYYFTKDDYSTTLQVSKGKYDREATDPYDGISVYKSDIEEYSLVNSLKYQDGKITIGFEYKQIEGSNEYISLSE